jgi:ferredoxin-NADP reductase
MANPITFRTEVIHIDRLHDDVATIEFRYLDRRPRHKPGQFLRLALDEYNFSAHWPDSRVFTIANGATDPTLIRLTIARKGAFTSRVLSELEVGSQVWMKAPYGEFLIGSLPGKEVVLIAGGTGVSPFVAFMEDALVNGLDGDVWLHYGARTPKLLSFRRLFDRCGETLETFRVRYYLESGSGHGADIGQIDLTAVCRELRDVTDTTFFVCGPPEMTRDFTSQLVGDFGVPKASVRVDAWG